MSEAMDIRRKRLRFRCWHRGTKELDLILGGFCDRELAGMSDRELDDFESLLEVPERTIYAWLTGLDEPPPGYRSGIIRRLRAFRIHPERL